jgi:hypothetical protein
MATLKKLSRLTIQQVKEAAARGEIEEFDAERIIRNRREKGRERQWLYRHREREGNAFIRDFSTTRVYTKMMCRLHDDLRRYSKETKRPMRWIIHKALCDFLESKNAGGVY